MRLNTLNAVAFLLIAVGSAPAISPDEGTDSQEKTTKVREQGDKKAKGDKSKSGDADTQPQPAKLRQITLQGNYVDLVQPLTLDPVSLVTGASPKKQRAFYRLCEFLDGLAKEDRYSYVALDLSDGQLAMNPAQLDELGRRLKKLTSSGKKTFAWMESASNVHLSIASNCDYVAMADLGGIDIPSLGMQAMFYRDAMDLLGIKASIVRAGDFKGAVEPYVNSKMSDHLRAHYLKMLESMNDAQVDRIARGRGLKHATVRELQKKRMLVPKEALQAGIVDRIAPMGSMRSTIEREIGEPIEWVTAKAAAKKQISVFQLMGQMMAGPTSSGGRIRENTIAVVHLSGAIIDGQKEAGGSIVSGPTVALLTSLAENDKVKGTVIRINSPGGSATASESIRQALVKLVKAKPTIISMGEMAASGGYWISCVDAPIYAEKGTLTGSIGVFSMKLSAGALMRRVGVQLESITLDESANAFALDRPWSEADTKNLQTSIDMFYRRFLQLVSKARGIPPKKAAKIAGGRVWSGSQAKQLKLVDEIGGVDDCLAVIAKRAKLEDYHIVHRPVPRSGLNLADILGQGGDEEIWQQLPLAAARILRQRGLSLEVTRLLLEDGFGRGKPTIWLLSPTEISLR